MSSCCGMAPYLKCAWLTSHLRLWALISEKRRVEKSKFVRLELQNVSGWSIINLLKLRVYRFAG